ncbi:SRPBCC domain-containing protein [Sphingobacterium corticis]|uniref:SRPBCC domain-containing protein n=1 Tax=Sphingobacterium corticis TaxID=1812823 RepID=A0ABW5NKD8_9SPHI
MHLDTIHIEVTYNVPAEKVWEALTLPDQIREWCFDVPTFSTEEGDEFEFSRVGRKRMFLHRCKILESVDKSLLKYTWNYPELMTGESVVTWELIPRGSATSVRLTHEHLLNHKEGGESFGVDNFEAGWGDVLKRSLTNYLEK